MPRSVTSQSKVRYIRARRRRRSAAPVFGLWLFLLCSCLLATYFFLNSPYFSLQHIDVHGTKVLEVQEIIELSGLQPGINIMQLDAAEAAKRIAVHPKIKQITAQRRLPSTLVLTITEREPVALVVGQDGFIAVDEEAVYLEKVSDLANWHFPLINGVPLDPGLKVGDSIEAGGLKSALQLIVSLDQDFLQYVAEINAPSDLSVSLKTIQGVEVRFGEPTDLERKIGLMQSLLMENGAIINNDTVEYIDLRYNTAPVIKRKGNNTK